MTSTTAAAGGRVRQEVTARSNLPANSVSVIGSWIGGIACDYRGTEPDNEKAGDDPGRFTLYE